MMKTLIFLPLSLLTACASTGAYNNEQTRTQCAIGYHEERNHSIIIVQSKDKDSEKQSRLKEDVRCVADSDQDRFLNQNHQ